MQLLKPPLTGYYAITDWVLEQMRKAQSVTVVHNERGSATFEIPFTY